MMTGVVLYSGNLILARSSDHPEVLALMFAVSIFAFSIESQGFDHTGDMVMF